MAVVVLGLVVLAGGALAAAASAAARRQHAYAPGTHAPRNDARRDPVGRALRHGYGGVEVAARLSTSSNDAHERLLVGANDDATDPCTTVDDLTSRLAAWVAEHEGRVYPGVVTTPFRVFVTITESDPKRQERAYELLDAKLRGYPKVFARNVYGTVVPGPVMVVLSGPHVPRKAMAVAAERYTFADGTFADLGPWGAPPSLAPLVSEQWFDRFDWDGRSVMPEDERDALHLLVAAAHAEGRQVRLDGLPRRPWRLRQAFWSELAAAGVDLVGTARPRAFVRFQRGYGDPPPALITATRNAARPTTTSRVAVHAYPAPPSKRLGRSGTARRAWLRHAWLRRSPQPSADASVPSQWAWRTPSEPRWSSQAAGVARSSGADPARTP